MQLAQLTPQEFDAHIQAKTFRLAFVGMSNAGKSYRSKVLQNEMDFLWYHIDEEIGKVLGEQHIDDLSAWLGYPSSPTYPQRERIYLDLENRFTQNAAMQTKGKNLVFDTTGSVVHLSEQALAILKENCLIVHLDVGEDSLETMIETFFAKPKPVAWCGSFTVAPGESEVDALKRSYPLLLKKRLTLYRTLAHVNIRASLVRDTSATDTLNAIRSAL